MFNVFAYFLVFLPPLFVCQLLLLVLYLNFTALFLWKVFNDSLLDDDNSKAIGFETVAIVFCNWIWLFIRRICFSFGCSTCIYIMTFWVRIWFSSLACIDIGYICISFVAYLNIWLLSSQRWISFSCAMTRMDFYIIWSIFNYCWLSYPKTFLEPCHHHFSFALLKYC